MGRAWWIQALVVVLGVSPGLASAQTNEESGWFAPAQSQTGVSSAGGPAAIAPAASEALDTDPRALSAFRSTLDKYGDWVDDARFGLVWIPSRRWVGDDFAPYLTRGRWALDSAGDWVWVSDYAFGPIVFHYGRWVWVVGVGWAWVPGYRYAPAWVSWRVPLHDGSYVGWAPMAPSYVWVSGVAVGVGFYVVTPWVFCPSYYVFSPHVHHHHVHDPSRMKEAARQTKPYSPANGERGPSPAAAGVPPSRVPVSRLPAQPRPAAPVDALPRQGTPPGAADWRRNLGDRAQPSVNGSTRAPSPWLSASERMGASGRSGALPAPKPRAPGSTSRSVPRQYSTLPRAGSSPLLPGASGASGARYEPGRAVVPRTSVVPQGVAPPRAPAPVRPR